MLLLPVVHAFAPRKFELRQQQERSKHLREIRRAQPGHRIPTLNRREARRATSLVPTRSNIIKDLRILIDRRIDKPHRTLSYVQPRGIYERHDRSKYRCAGTCSVHVLELAIDGNHVVDAIGRDVRKTAGSLGGVVLGGGIRGLVFCEIGLDG